jgi:hypothetical protein
MRPEQKRGLSIFNFFSDELSTLVKTELQNGFFKDLQGIYKFIIHMHKVYQVPLDQKAKPGKEKVLLDTMESAFCKYVKHCPNDLNISLTLSIQFTSM